MFLFGKKADIDIELTNSDSRKVATYDDKEYPIFYDGETVSGKVNINVRPGKKLDHQGILIELIGKIDFQYDRGASQEFLCLEKDLARHGVLVSGQVSYPFEFKNVRKQYETYRGVNVNLLYVLRVHILQRINNIVKEKEIEVQTLSLYQETDEGVRMEVGIEDSLHIEFEYSSTRYHLEDVIVGKIYFILVRVKIKHMDLQIIRHETVGRAGTGMIAESSYLNKYELMDGSPVRGENIPVRLFLKDVGGLRPSMHEVAGGLFSVRYFLNLVLTDEDDRRYYKQQEIFLYRRGEKRHEPIAGRSQAVQSLLQQGHLRNFMVPQSSSIAPTATYVPTNATVRASHDVFAPTTNNHQQFPHQNHEVANIGETMPQAGGDTSNSNDTDNHTLPTTDSRSENSSNHHYESLVDKMEHKNQEEENNDDNEECDSPREIAESLPDH